MSFVTAYSKTTGEKQSIPKKWLEHPVLGKDFELTPSQRAALQQQNNQLPPLPDTDADLGELLQYAADHQIDIGDAQDEAEVLAAITKHHESR